MEVKATVKKWGSSLGLVLSKDFVDHQQLKENDQIILVIKKRHFAKEFFGILPKLNMPTDEIKKEMKRGW